MFCVLNFLESNCFLAPLTFEILKVVILYGMYICMSVFTYTCYASIMYTTNGVCASGLMLFVFGEGVIIFGAVCIIAFGQRSYFFK